MDIEQKLQAIITCAHRCFLVASIALFAPLPAESAEIMVRGEPVSEADIAALPPVCQLIMKNKGINQVVGQARNAELFSRPEYHMVKGNIHLHHYCWGLVEKQRYIRARTRAEQDHYFNQAMGDIGYVISYSDKDWQYFHVMLVEQGTLLQLRGNYPASLTKAAQALQYKPDYEAAYILKLDVYKAMGNQKAAVATGLEGLEKIPNSVALRKRLARLGQSVPPPNTDTPDTPKQGAAAEETNVGNTPQQRPVPLPSEPALPAAPAPAKPYAEPEQTQPKNNPYCRFCP
jgi:hypothetical protein